MKKKICVLTATRAEYGLLRPIIRQLGKEPEFDVRVVVTGAHLSPEFGLTYQEIAQDGIRIDDKIEILLSADTPSSISKAMGLAMIGFADYFARVSPDMLLVLGDRYETLAVCCTALNQRIPISHLYGGETTEGAVDESIRHAITKMSYLHFTSTGEYRNRVIQLGEHPDRVFNVGAIGIENIRKEKLLDRSELETFFGFKPGQPYAVVTFHPVTLEDNHAAEQIQALLNVCTRFKDMMFVFTKANADAQSRIINQKLEEAAQHNHHMVCFSSLGTIRFLSAVKYSAMVIGNSSSGLVEAPSFGVPTVNIGDRQKGRLQADSVINCSPNEAEIEKAINLALTKEFIERAQKTVNPYGDGHTSGKIVGRLREFLLEGKIDLKKKFYDCKIGRSF
jgi:GDP/UDP-N,N'-diacetylbacillosamine 2-epimerase (hydrolysing)